MPRRSSLGIPVLIMAGALSWPEVQESTAGLHEMLPLTAPGTIRDFLDRHP